MFMQGDSDENEILNNQLLLLINNNSRNGSNDFGSDKNSRIILTQ